jgi:hypothetical protein
MISDKQMSQQNLWILFLVCGGPGTTHRSPLNLALVTILWWMQLVITVNEWWIKLIESLRNIKNPTCRQLMLQSNTSITRKVHSLGRCVFATSIMIHAGSEWRLLQTNNPALESHKCQVVVLFNISWHSPLSRNLYFSWIYVICGAFNLYSENTLLKSWSQHQLSWGFCGFTQSLKANSGRVT